MDTADRPSGINVVHSDTVAVGIRGIERGGVGQRAARAAVVATPEGRQVVRQAQEGGLDFAAEVTIRPPSGGMRAVPGELAIDVPVATNERAVILLESNGVYAWRSPDPVLGSGGVRRVPPGNARFTLAGLGAGTGPADTRGQRGLVLDWLVDRAEDVLRSYVFRFVASAAANAALQAYENLALKQGLVHITGFDPATWTPGAALPAFDQSKPAKVLLLVHGTFSTTAGSFGALTGQAAGRAFLDSAYRTYDAVLGYDHSTLADEPDANATKILDAIKCLPPDTVIDAIAYSRGGLVARLLSEKLLPSSSVKLAFDRMIFVGCTNGGTHLAEPKNLEATVDLYTNVVIAGARALSIVPALVPTSEVVSTGMKIIAALARFIAQTAVTDRAVPGLAAMRPDDDTVKQINEATGPVAAKAYYAVTSSFMAGENNPGFTKALREFVLDRVTNRVFQNAQNDLVVDTKSMTQLGQRAALLTKRDDYGDTSEVYHTIYFAQDRVARNLSSWLDLPELPEDYVVPTIELDADLSAREALRRLEGQSLNASVLIRLTEGTEPLPKYYYVRPVSEIAAHMAELAGQPVGPDLQTILQLHEGGASRTYSADGQSPQGANLSPQLQFEMLDTTADIAQQGDVAFGLGGAVIGVRMRGPAAIPVSAADRVLSLEPGIRSRGSVAGGLPASDGAEPAVRSPAPPADEQPVSCEFAAEMPPNVAVNEEVALVVTVSREAIALPQSPVARTGHSEAVRRSLPIELEVRALGACGVIDGDGELATSVRMRVPVPLPGAPTKAAFTLKGVRKGKADVIVTASQDGLALVTFILNPVVGQDNTLKVLATAEVGPTPKAQGNVVVRIFESRDATVARLRFIVDSPTLHINREADTDALGRVDDFVTDLFRKIEQARLSTQTYPQFEERLRRLGNTIWTKLVPLDVQRELSAVQNHIDAIQVISQQAGIPWELAVISTPGTPLPLSAPFLAEKGLVRWVQNVGWPGSDLKIGDDALRYVAPNYPDPGYTLPGAALEVARLKALFGAAREVPATVDDVLGVVQGGSPPEVLHFICHGDASSAAIWDASLLLTGTVDPSLGYSPELLSTTDIEPVAVMRTNDNPGSIVFLNACRVGRLGAGLIGCGGFAEAFLRPASRAGASVFVGPLWNVDDNSAVVFAETFYGELMAGTTLVESTKAARQAARAKQDATWLAYSVYGDPFARRVQ